MTNIDHNGHLDDSPSNISENELGKDILYNLANNWQDIIDNKITGSESNKEKSYYQRIKKLLSMDDLTLIEGHPVQMIVKRIKNSDFYHSYSDVESKEISTERATFDLFNFPPKHVARRTSDSYFIQKTKDPKTSILLRPHTSVVWYDYFINQGGISKLHNEGEIKVLSSGKVYRVDTLDKTHHECFHQIDGLKVVEKSKEVITQKTLKVVLTETIEAVFGEGVEIKFLEDSFPYTTKSLEAYVKHGDSRIEVLGAGLVHPNVFKKLGIDPEKYNGRAYGFGIERLAMALKKVPDIRLFRNKNPNITKQWGDFQPFKEVSKFPPVLKDISFLIAKDKFIKDEDESSKVGNYELTKNTESDLFEIAALCRDVGGDIVESIKIIDMFENDQKFGSANKSISIRISFRSLERTLTNDEVNDLYFDIRDKIENELGYTLR